MSQRWVRVPCGNFVRILIFWKLFEFVVIWRFSVILSDGLKSHPHNNFVRIFTLAEKSSEFKFWLFKWISDIFWHLSFILKSYSLKKFRHKIFPAKYPYHHPTPLTNHNINHSHGPQPQKASKHFLDLQMCCARGQLNLSRAPRCFIFNSNNAIIASVFLFLL